MEELKFLSTGGSWDAGGEGAKKEDPSRNKKPFEWTFFEIEKYIEEKHTIMNILFQKNQCEIIKIPRGEKKSRV